jgi:hypothetical protein
MEDDDVTSLVQTSKNVISRTGKHAPAHEQEHKGAKTEQKESSVKQEREEFNKDAQGPFGLDVLEDGASFDAAMDAQAALDWPISDKFITGIDRQPQPSSTDKTEDAAIVDAFDLDAGAVHDSFARGMKGTRDEIELKADDRIQFTNSQRLQRKSDRTAAEAAIAADKAAIKDAVAKYHADVAAAKAQRKQATDRAAEKVSAAKEAAMATKIKAAQAEHAAVLGRKVGVIEGTDEANFEWSQYRKEIANEKAAAARAAASAAIAKKEAAVKAAMTAKTEMLAAKSQAIVAAAEKRNKLIEARSRAAASMKMQQIGGAESLKNRMTETKADWAVKNYNQIIDEDKEVIDLAAKGQWPPGDWPLGP